MICHDKGMARGLPIGDGLPVEVMAVLLDVRPSYYAQRYLFSTREAREDLGCSLQDIKTLCSAGKLRYHVNAAGTIYLSPDTYNALVADIRAKRCTVKGLIHEHMLATSKTMDCLLAEVLPVPIVEGEEVAL